jgi:anaerobic selenocysteine-containing dehydrogenase
MQAKKNGAKEINAHPPNTPTRKQPHLHQQIYSGTDGALNN